MYTSDSDRIDLSADASRSTLGMAASWLGWALMLGLAVVTAVHAISLTLHHTSLNPSTGDAFTIIRVVGVALVELFAIVTAVMLATHQLRARQKPAAMALELTWAAFAAVNLISSFAVEHGGDLPAFVSSWVTYGLPVSALIVGIEFYVMLRLNPDAKRADDEAELRERFARIKHDARLEVMASPQMQAVIRQMMWQQLPPVIGRELNLSDAQVAALIRQAPQLLDLNGNGIPDIAEARDARHPSLQELASALAQYLPDEDEFGPATPIAVGNRPSPNGKDGHPL